MRNSQVRKKFIDFTLLSENCSRTHTISTPLRSRHCRTIAELSQEARTSIEVGLLSLFVKRKWHGYLTLDKIICEQTS